MYRLQHFRLFGVMMLRKRGIGPIVLREGVHLVSPASESIWTTLNPSPSFGSTVAWQETPGQSSGAAGFPLNTAVGTFRVISKSNWSGCYFREFQKCCRLEQDHSLSRSQKPLVQRSLQVSQRTLYNPIEDSSFTGNGLDSVHSSFGLTTHGFFLW